MKKLLFAVALITAACAPGSRENDEVALWQARAEGIEIIRDD